MPEYDYKCKNCNTRFTLFYKTYADYDVATSQCPNCDSTDLARIITNVSIPTLTRDYTKMSSGEMLSVLDSGDSRQVGEMFQQVGGSDPALGADFHNATQDLLKGKSKDKVEKDLRASDKSSPKPKSKE